VNRNIARPRGLHLDVYRWETDSYPGFHPQGPQDLIDPTLKIETCDILIGIFWRRFGTPVSDAKSGTEHEFRLAYEAWKKNGRPQIMVYFSQKAYAPKSTEETDQWGLVLKFKKEFPREGLWWEYKTKVEFEQLTRNHLTNFLSQQLPLDKPTPAAPAALTPLFQLPPPPADFTGRTAELAELRAAIEKGGIHISGLQGQGGVGKTALALKLAEELSPNYPDAQIYLDLKGVSEKPLTAPEAMSHVLRTFHPEAKLPEKEEELRAQYLSVLHNKRALLLMDNAKDAAQVQPLTPPRGCTLLVTSRLHFALPGLQAKNLETLPPPDAKDLLLQITPRIGVEAETIAKLCGYLPQALRLAASAIAVRVNLEPQDYARQLADEKKRLELLACDDDSVTASISLSYNLLDAETQKRWRMLAVFPDTFDAPAAAAVWEIETDAAQGALSRLLQFSLLEWNDATKRYHLHDLMRDFARQRLTHAESDATSRNHAKHYGSVLGTADDLYLKGGDSLMRGLALFDIEWGNAQAGQGWAEAHSAGEDEAARLCSGYPNWGTYILDLRQHPREQIRWIEAAVAAARQLKDRAAEGRHLGGLGYAYDSVGDYRHAIEYYEAALRIIREIGDRGSEGAALGNLGIAYGKLDETRRSIEYFEQRLAIAREIDDRRGEGNALGNLGIAYGILGEARRAIEYSEKALTIIREIGDRRAEGNVLGNLGLAYSNLDETRRAIEYYERQLTIAREIGDRRGEGNALWNMSLALDELGDRKKAIGHAEAALKIFEEIEDPNAAEVRKRLDIWKDG
jgi:tetratricopeptide (TPR) repeat protein